MKKIIKIILRIFLFVLLILIILAVANLLLKRKNEINNSNYMDMYDNDYLLLQNNLKTKTSMFWLTMDGMTFELLNDEIEEKQPGKKRILFVGDSFIWGPMNNNVNTIFWKKLQRMFEENGYNDIEILAAGNCGMGTYDEIKYLLENEEYLNRIKPDLVVLCFLDNDWDIADDKSDFFIPRFVFDEYVNKYYSNGIWNLIKRYYPYLYDWYINTKITKMTGAEDYNIKYGSKYGYFFNDIYELENIGVIDKNDWFLTYEKYAVRTLSNIEYPFMIFNEIFPFTIPWSLEFREKAVELFKKYDLELINPVSEFNDLVDVYGLDALANNENDWHPSEILNNFYAEILYKYLLTNYKNVVGEKSKVKDFDIEINDYYPYTKINLVNNGNYKYSFMWPDDNDMPYYWTNTHTVKLNLKYPMKLSELKLKGYFNDARIWVNPENGQDEYIELDNAGNIFKVLEDRKISSINIHINADVGTKVNLEIKKAS